MREYQKLVAARRMIVPPPHILSPESGEATWTIYLDLDVIDGDGVPHPVPSGSAGGIGRGHLSGTAAPTREPAPTTGIVRVPDPDPEPRKYVAYCGQMHEPGASGVSPDGSWGSGFLESCAEAFGAADAHVQTFGHPVDRVEEVINWVGVSIAQCP